MSDIPFIWFGVERLHGSSMCPRTIIPSLDLANVADNLIAAFLDTLIFSSHKFGEGAHLSQVYLVLRNFRNVIFTPSDLSWPGRVFPFPAFQALCYPTNRLTDP